MTQPRSSIGSPDPTVPRVVRDVDQVLSLWAAHESGELGEEDTSRVGPKGFSNYRPEMIGLTAREQAHAYVAAIRGGSGVPGYRLAYPVLWWAHFRRGPFRAQTFLVARLSKSSASEAAALAELGYEGRNVRQVLNLFIGRMERTLAADPLVIYPMIEAPCVVELAGVKLNDPAP